MFRERVFKYVIDRYGRGDINPIKGDSLVHTMKEIDRVGREGSILNSH